MLRIVHARMPTTSKVERRVKTKATSDDASQREAEPPPLGFDVFRADELDPVAGRSDQWVFMGVVGRRSIIRAGFSSWGSACRAAWAVRAGIDEARIPTSDRAADRRAVPSLSLEPERWQPPAWTKPPAMRDFYTVRVGTWDAMLADLLSQILADAGSIRRAAKAVEIPRSTLASWVKDFVERRLWPAVT